jgi:hypothetical protein
MDLAGLQGEINSVIGQYRAEAFTDPRHRYYGMKVTRHIFESIQCLKILGSSSYGSSLGSDGG